jgi:glycosyltransferase involved in cell wall biosynthesis
MENIKSNESPEISVVVPISERHDDMKKLYNIYADELKALKRDCEFLFILDGSFSAAFKDLLELKNGGNPIRIIKLAKNFGESAALSEGFRQSRGDIILTMASYIQIEPKDLGNVFKAYDKGNDLVITRRYPRKDPLINRVQSYVFHFLVRKMTGAAFRDVTSGTRLINKKILSEFNLYGDRHRFIPIMALSKGIKVDEVNVNQREEDTKVRLVKPGAYLRRGIDLLTLFFLIKFTVKPLRFFGLIGSALCFPGLVITASLGVLRIMGKIDLATRPLLLLGLLLIVFGIQLFSVGLIGELILFTRAKEMEHYRIEEIID